MLLQSRLLVTNVLDRDSILLCEAEITTDLLNALRNLKTATTPVKWPVIRRKKIPYKPYDSFARRLMDELVASSSSSATDHVENSNSNKTKDTILKTTRRMKVDHARLRGLQEHERANPKRRR
jgi:hypothetical protein